MKLHNEASCFISIFKSKWETLKKKSPVFKNKFPFPCPSRPWPRAYTFSIHAPLVCNRFTQHCIGGILPTLLCILTLKIQIAIFNGYIIVHRVAVSLEYRKRKGDIWADGHDTVQEMSHVAVVYGVLRHFTFQERGLAPKSWLLWGLIYLKCIRWKLSWSQICFEAILYSFPVLISFKGQHVLQKAEWTPEVKQLTPAFCTVAGLVGVRAGGLPMPQFSLSLSYTHTTTSTSVELQCTRHIEYEAAAECSGHKRVVWNQTLILMFLHLSL